MRSAFLRLFLAAICAVPWAAVAPADLPAVVEGIRIWAAPDNTRVVLDISHPVEHSLFPLDNPSRVVIDLHPGHRDETLTPLPEGQGYVTRIRSAPRLNGDLRVVLDLSQPVKPRSFYAQPNDTYGHRLVIDLARPGDGVPVKVAPAPGPDGRDVIVAIDPGHGGEDPGASGRKGTREKDVVMQISRRLHHNINSEPGMRAVLVRNGDYNVSLRRRIENARSHSADLFISIHADAFRDERARGSSVYVLSAHGAGDEAARWLAERENAADLVGGVSLDDKDDMLASVLLDLSQSATISASMAAGEAVLGELTRVGRVRKKTVQQAGFVVLKSPDIPSILVETAFISNPREEANLRSKDHQEKLARALHRGILEYFYNHPPVGTRLASLDEGQRLSAIEHVTIRGDSLSKIADRYNVSVRRLKTENGINGDTIQIGQVLKIPIAGT